MSAFPLDAPPDPQPRLLIATNNPGKVAELRVLFGTIPFGLVMLQDIGITQSAEEPYHTYLENATAKARAYANATGLLALADDSGLEIDAMPGELGVDTAHYGGTTMPYPERFMLIADQLRTVPTAARTARYRCVMVLAEPGSAGRTRSVEGICEGTIHNEARGEHGFGFDPIFYVPAFGKTMAELVPAEKNAISHRARAALQMASILQNWPDLWT